LDSPEIQWRAVIRNGETGGFALRTTPRWFFAFQAENGKFIITIYKVHFGAHLL
jgi:hypothetical protein